MRRQHLRRAVKRVFTGNNWWRRLGGEKTDMWQHPQTTSNCCRWQPPCIWGHDSPRSGIRAGGNLLTFGVMIP